MPVTVHRLYEKWNYLHTTPNHHESFRSLKTALTELRIRPDALVKVGKRGEYPMISGVDALPEETAAFRVHGEYLLFIFRGGEAKYARHCWLFDRGDTPFTPENLKSPPPPRPKRESEMTLREMLFKRWRGEKEEPTLFV